MTSAMLLLASCGDADTDDAATNSDSSSGWSAADAGRSDGAPTITEPTGDAPDSLEVTDIAEGDGTEVTNGSVAVVDYVGASFSNGTVFDASYGRSPFPVTVGAGRVIKGWDEGLVGMKVGGKRQLVIPADLGYGDTGSPPDIAPGETLIFIIELRAVVSRPENPEPTGDVTELTTETLVEGSGDAVVESGSQATVHYIGVHATTGEPFDASWDRGEPFTVAVGSGSVIAGWDQGLVGMKLGERRLLTIPSDLAYGPEGRPPLIAADEDLVFVVDLVGIA